MIKTIKSKLFIRRFILFIFDIAVIIAASALGLLFRFDFVPWEIDPIYINTVLAFLPVNIIMTLLIFYIFRLYHSLWNFAGYTEVKNIFFACVLSSFLQMLGLEVLNYPIPRSFYFLYGVCLFLLTTLCRFSYRLIRDIRKKKNTSELTNAMIVGGGEATNIILEEIKFSCRIGLVVKCIIDDAPSKQGRFIQGVKVAGTRKDIPEMAKRYNIDEIIISMPSVSKKQIREIVNICKQTKCRLKTLPGLYQLVNGEVSINRLRNVDIEDLLGRDPIKLDLESIMNYVNDKVVLVTGAGGSIGSELCRQIATYCPRQLVMLDIYENSLYDVQQELKKRFPFLDVVVLIASIRNAGRINQIFETYRPDIVYHAAAHKHVPLMEDSPNEAIKNNVFGTLNTVLAADQYGVKRFVMISTDKAVNPTNIMGASKRICEMIIRTYNERSKTEFVAVRFGNVLGSNGSVIPLFKKQITEGGPVTVTHPEVVRYFMTIPEAVSLVLQAGSYAKGGEIFVLDMGEPVKILDLAKNLIELSGYKPNEDIMIEFTGLRPGEKMYEELIVNYEGMQETVNKLIFIEKPGKWNREKFLKQIDRLNIACCQEPDNIREMVQEIVPTYRILNEENKTIRVIGMNQEAGRVNERLANVVNFTEAGNN